MIGNDSESQGDLSYTQATVDSVVQTMSIHNQLLQSLVKQQLEVFKETNLDNDPEAITLLSKYSRPSSISSLTNNFKQLKTFYIR
jgi:hypothetical protein